MHNNGWAWLFLEGYGADGKSDGLRLRKESRGSHHAGAKGLPSYTEQWALSIASCDPLIMRLRPMKASVSMQHFNINVKSQLLCVMFPYVSFMKCLSTKQKFFLPSCATRPRQEESVEDLLKLGSYTWNCGRKDGAKGSKKMRIQLSIDPEMGREWNWRIPESRVWCQPVN